MYTGVYDYYFCAVIRSEITHGVVKSFSNNIYTRNSLNSFIYHLVTTPGISITTISFIQTLFYSQVKTSRNGRTTLKT